MEVPEFSEVEPDPDEQREDESFRVSLMNMESEIREESTREQEVSHAMQVGQESQVEGQQEIQDLQGFSGPEMEGQERNLHYLPVHLHLETNQIVHPKVVRHEDAAPVVRIQLNHIELVVSELLQQLLVRDRIEILQIISLNTAHETFIISIFAEDGIILQVSNANQQILRALEGPPPLLALEGPPPLLALEGPPALLALEGPPALLALEGPPALLALEGPPALLVLGSPLRLVTLIDTQRLSALECSTLLLALDVQVFLTDLDVRPFFPAMNGRFPLPSLNDRFLLPALGDRPLLPDSEEQSGFSEGNEMCSELKEKRDLEEQGPSERESSCLCEPAEVLAIRPRKTKEHNDGKRRQRAQPVDSREAGATLAVSEDCQDVENHSQDVSDPGEPEFSDPRELLKDLSFGEMTDSNLGMGHIEDLEESEMESFRGFKTKVEGEEPAEFEEETAEDEREAVEVGAEEAVEVGAEEAVEVGAEEAPEVGEEPRADGEEQQPIEEVIELPEPDRAEAIGEIPDNRDIHPIEEVIEIPAPPRRLVKNGRLPNRSNIPRENPNVTSRGERFRQRLSEICDKQTRIDLFLLICFMIILYAIKHMFSIHTTNATEPTSDDMVFNVTTSMTTTVFNATHSDYNVTAPFMD